MIQQEEKEKDYGTVVGVKGDAVALRNNIMNVVNDERAFDPVAYISPEIIEYDGKTLIGIRVPASGEIHSYKGVVYDRNGDADVRVRSTAAKGMMLLRKQGIFTEQRAVYSSSPRVHQIASEANGEASVDVVSAK